MVKKYWECILILLLLGFLGASAQEQVTGSFLVMVTVSTQSQGAVDLRNQAEQKALRQAVERFILENLPEDRMQEGLSRLTPLLLEDPGTYVRDFRILGTVQEGESYRLVARVSVDAGGLTRRMEDMGLGFSRLPGILFMVSEQGLEDAEPRRWWDPDARISRTGGRSMEALVTAMGNAGFNVLIPDDRSLFADGSSPSAVLDNREARRIAALFGAPVVLVGRAEAVSEGRMGEGLEAFRGGLFLVALDTETGDILAEVEDSQVVLNASAAAGEREALYQAGTRVGSRMATELQTAWLHRAALKTAVSEIRMEIRGDNYLSRFVSFRKILAETEGVVSIERREITARGMEIRVRYQGSAAALAAALLGKKYDRLGIQISEVEENSLRVTLHAAP